jgi:hypothetical protein
MEESLEQNEAGKATLDESVQQILKREKSG